MARLVHYLCLCSFCNSHEIFKAIYKKNNESNHGMLDDRFDFVSFIFVELSTYDEYIHNKQSHETTKADIRHLQKTKVIICFVLLGLRLYVSVNKFSVMSERFPATLRSRVRHSTDCKQG